MLATTIVIKGKDGYGKEKITSVTVLHDEGVDPIQVINEQLEITLVGATFEKYEPETIKASVQFSEHNPYMKRK